MPSDLERLVAELRAIAAEIERLRPALARHATSVRQYAAEVAAGADGRSGPRGHTASLLNLAARRCDALVAELANARLAANHFAGRVLSGGGAEGGALPPAGTVIAPPSPGGDDDGDAKPGYGVGRAALRTRDEPDKAADGPGPGGVEGRGGRSTGSAGGHGAVDAKPGADPYVPWWIPNGAPWLGHRGIAPRRDENGAPLTRFSPRDLTLPQAAGAEARGGHGGDHVPPARIPISDPSRDLVTAFIEAGYTSPDALPKGLVEERCYWMDQSGHAALRHADLPHSKLIDRVIFGTDPITGATRDWETGGEHNYSRDATSFASRAALVFAEARIWGTEKARDARNRAVLENRERFIVVETARELLGADFARHLRGWTRTGTRKAPSGCRATTFNDKTTIVATYVRQGPEAVWAPYTIYARPGAD